MSRFKTELCNNLIELGSCKYGDRCHYAHGAHELRTVSKCHPKYRTERCKNFELTGKCPFGPRCSYVHPKPDLDSMIEQLTKYMKHTKAPKPDSEDDDEMSLFTTITSKNNDIDTSSMISTCDSNATPIGDENKENRLVAHYHISSESVLRDRFIEYEFTPKNINTDIPTANTSASTTNPSLRRNDSCSSSSTVTIFSFKDSISSQAEISSCPILRTPLSNNNRLTNALSSSSNIPSNRQTNLPQKRPANDPTSNVTTSTINNITCGNNLSFFESTSFEANKKLQLISTNPSNGTASNPFGINNPFSDYLNNTNIIGRNHLQPNKQLYTRF